MINSRREEKEFMDHQLVKRTLSLLMISTCQRKKSMELNHHLNSSDNILIIRDGMIENQRRSHSTKLKTPSFWLLWDHQEVVDLLSQKDSKDISML
jgi:hypothetical protein